MAPPLSHPAAGGQHWLTCCSPSRRYDDLQRDGLHGLSITGLIGGGAAGGGGGRGGEEPQNCVVISGACVYANHAMHARLQMNLACAPPPQAHATCSAILPSHPVDPHAWRPDTSAPSLNSCFS